MLMHASCAGREDKGILLTGPPGSGKSDLLLRLLDRGFMLVADDQVDIGADGLARAPDSLAGLLEVAGLGLMRLPFIKEVQPVLVAELGPSVPRLPRPERDGVLGVPRLQLDPRGASAAARLALAFDCLLGRASMTVGAFAA
jgi:HPr kinase/phosphorylase